MAKLGLHKAVLSRCVTGPTSFAALYSTSPLSDHASLGPMTVSPSVPRCLESFWPARIAIVAVAALQITLNERLTLGPNWLLPGLEMLLLIPLALVRTAHATQVSTQLNQQSGSPAVVRGKVSHGTARGFSFFLISLLNLANLISLLLLVESLLHGSKATGKLLLIDAMNIWFTNIIIYALWYWELDRGGPFARSLPENSAGSQADFLFPQMSTNNYPNWQPRFVDYLFLAFTNATAFSPTDTLPLTGNAKILMMVQSGISLLTVALVASRAVNILS